MRYSDLERRRTTAWPWVAGAAMFGLILWAVTALLAAPREEEDLAATTTSEDTLPPAAIPAPPAPIRDMGAGQDIGELAPLAEEHAGASVRAEGEVVATGTAGFWMVTGGMVLRVDSERAVRRGDPIVVQGVLHPADDEERTDQIASEVLGRGPEAASWEVVRAVRLVESDDEDAA